MLEDKDKQKSPQRRFLLIFGGVVFVALVTLGLLILFDQQFFPSLERPMRTWFGILVLIYAVLRVSRIFKKERMKFKLSGLLMAIMLWLGFQGCSHKNDKNAARLDRFTNDSAKVAVDEAFKPIFDEELYVFKALNDKVHPRMIYLPENKVIDLLLEDSVRVALLSRKLTPDELLALKQRTLNPTMDRFALDAIALIVNKSSADTTFSVSRDQKYADRQRRNR